MDLHRFLLLLIFIFLAGVTYQDFRHRSVNIWIFIGLFISAIIYRTAFVGIWYFLKTSCLNVLVIAIQLAFLGLYFSLKTKTRVNILDKYIGLGDIVFFVIAACFFPVIKFTYFLVISETAALASYSVLRFFFKQEETIPLAGAQAVCLSIWLSLGYS